MRIQTIPNLSPNRILLPDRFSSIMKQEDRWVNFHFGAWVKKVQIQYDGLISEDTIGLPANYSRNFTIPTALDYEIIVDGPHIHIGPVIAFMVSRKK